MGMNPRLATSSGWLSISSAKFCVSCTGFLSLFNEDLCRVPKAKDKVCPYLSVSYKRLEAICAALLKVKELGEREYLSAKRQKLLIHTRKNYSEHSREIQGEQSRLSQGIIPLFQMFRRGEGNRGQYLHSGDWQKLPV